MTTPIEYVEKELGAHTVWEETRRVLTDLEEGQRTRDSLSASLRVLRHDLEVRQSFLLDKIITDHEGDVKRPAEAQIDRELKAAMAKDAVCQQMKVDIVNNQNHLEDVEGKVRTMEFRLKALTARTTDIAGILQFYAACKNAQTEARKLQVGNPAISWPF